MSQMSNYSDPSQEDQLRASRQAQKDLQNLFRTKKKSLKKYLEDLFLKQMQQIKEEESIIQQILEKKPEYRNTTARFLKQSQKNSK